MVRSNDTLYVDATATGANNGTSWENAYINISSALINNAGYGDQVWVAKGTYQPTTGNTRSISLFLPNGVKVYGGFEGGEASIDQRDWIANPTIFSGDIGMVGDSTDNSYTVLIISGADSTTLLDGIIIEKGHANGDSDISDFFVNGGGIYISGFNNIPEARPRIQNCTIRNNFAANRGGGVFVESASGQWCGFEFRNCSFLNNEAQNGGGIAIRNSTILKTSQFIQCDFEGNFASQRGGGVYILTTQGNSGLDIEQCTLDHNVCIVDGGGIYWENLSGTPQTLRGHKNILIDCQSGEEIGNGGLGGAITIFDFSFSNAITLNSEKSLFKNWVMG